MRTGGPITCSVSATSTGVGPIIAGNIVDVEVDPETGKVDILRYTAFLDAGTAVHPSYVEGQIQGGTVQGIGWALNEEYVYTSDGVMLNSSFLDYRMPTILDVPMIDTVIIEVPNPRHHLWSAWGRRGANHSTVTGTCQRRISRHRGPNEYTSDVSRGYIGGSAGEKRPTLGTRRDPLCTVNNSSLSGFKILP